MITKSSSEVRTYVSHALNHTLPAEHDYVIPYTATPSLTTYSEEFIQSQKKNLKFDVKLSQFTILSRQHRPPPQFIHSFIHSFVRLFLRSRMHSSLMYLCLHVWEPIWSLKGTHACRSNKKEYATHPLLPRSGICGIAMLDHGGSCHQYPIKKLVEG